MTILLTQILLSHELPVYKLMVPTEVHAIDSTLLEVVTHRTEPLKLTLSRKPPGICGTVCNHLSYKLCNFGHSLAKEA